MDRFKLEELITSVSQICEDLQVVMEGHFDREKGLTEDQILNMIIGMQELHKCRCDMLWECFEQMVEEGKIT
jgi:hypothetical protein